MTRARALGLAQLVYLVALVSGAAWLLADRGDDVRVIAQGANLGLIVAALALLVAQTFLSTLVWRETLAVFGEDVSFGALWRAVGRTLPTRYVPGGIWMVVSRGSVLRRRGVALAAVSASAVLEQGVALVLGLVVGVFALLATGDGPVNAPLLAVVGVVGVIVCTPTAINTVQRIAARGAKVDPVRGAAYGRLLVVVLAYTAWSALSFAVYLQAFPAIDVDLVRAGGAYLVAWVIGFVAVFAPQGAGVADTATAVMLTSGAVAPLALVVGGFRVVVLIRDVLVALAATLQREE